MGKKIFVLYLIVLVLAFAIGVLTGVFHEDLTLMPELREAKKQIVELENKLKIGESIFFKVRQSGMAVKNTGIVKDGTSLAEAGVPVGSLIAVVAGGKIFAGHMYTPMEGNPFPVVEIYRWETDTSPRQVLKKLPE